MASPTELYLSPSLPYPIKLVSLAVSPNTDVQRGTRLLDYSFTHLSPDARPELRFGTWDSSLDGTLTRWSLNKGDIITARRARDSPAAYILEPCKHGVQLAGLCCLCGKDMTSFDYTGFSDASRASIQMTHLANGPTVSLEEAQRIEQETAQHLLASRKLSLIVDLDQTIVHATVDPTVGEWIDEGEAWEARQANKVAEVDDNKQPDQTTTDAEDQVNPNWEALKDVKKFRLGPETLGQPHQRPKHKAKEKLIEQEGCMYYIKPRPGLLDFLQTMVNKYEMHVYTMGTRAYAENVCAAIDPGGKIFGNRILSRDESGSLTQKSLHRLFPCDQSMVVIIDDRADVWEWSPSLVKVIPYDFFVGIGDINSAFLPKLQPLAPEVPPPPPPTTADPSGPQPVTAVPNEEEEAGDDLEEELPELSDGPSSQVEDDLAELEKDEMISRNTLALEAQVEERPLAKKQEELLVDETAERDDTPSLEAQSTPNGTPAPDIDDQQAKKEKHVRKALLKNEDMELMRVKEILDHVHERYYTAYDTRKLEDERKAPKVNQGSRSQRRIEHNVQTIIPRIRMQTLAGVRLLFTSIIPLNVQPETTEIWKTATAFGAECHTELSPRITHVVTKKTGTQKIDAARRHASIKIVWLEWLTDSIALWHRQDEAPYLLEPEPAGGAGGGAAVASPPSDPHQISSDPEPDADDWDELREGRALGAEGTDEGGGRVLGALGVEGPGEGDGAGESRSGDGDAVALELDAVDWDEINNELDEFMNESDDDESGGGGGKEMLEDEEFVTDESNSVAGSTTSSPRRKRKRVRSLTPSELGALNGAADADALRSPLAKRKKLAADRSGASRLKEAFTAEQLRAAARRREEHEDDEESVSRSGHSSPANGAAGEDDDDDDEDDDDDDDDQSESNMAIEDDFLARELEAEWG